MAQKLTEEARALGRRGGVKRMLALTPAERTALGRLAAAGRWRKWREQQERKAS